MSRKMVVEVDGKQYGAVVGEVKSTFLGVEDHGIFTAHLVVEWPSGGVAVGGYALDEWNAEAEARLGAGVGVELVKEFISVLGATSWEDLPGRGCVVLFESVEGGGLGQRAVGVGHVSDEKRVLVLGDWFDRQRERGLVGS